MKNIKKEKTIRCIGYELPYTVIDKQADETLLFVHGIASGSSMVDALVKLNFKFNVIAINLPGSLQMKCDVVRMEDLIAITREFIRRTKTKVTLVGHSLGGAVVAEVWDEPNVERIVYASALFPFDKTRLSYRGFKSFFEHAHVYNSVHKVAKVIDGHVSTPKVSEELNKYVTGAQPYRNLFLDYIFNDEKRKGLIEKYKGSLSKETHFLIGEHDKIVATDEFIHFVQDDLKRKVWVLDDAGHSIIRKNSVQVLDYLNNNIPVGTRERGTVLFDEDK